MLIYTPRITNRIKYIFEFIFIDILQLTVEFTDNKEHFIQAKGPKINYSRNKFNDELFIYANSLLFEKEVKPRNIIITKWKQHKTFFQTDNFSFLPFDLFAASFYLVSRYEEILPYTPDIHGRFKAAKSLAYQKGFLRAPVIDEWVMEFKEKIQRVYPGLKIPNRYFKHLPTIDIDNAYAYLYKGLVRTVGATARSIFHLDFKDNVERTKVLTKNQKDPFDNYEYMDILHNQYGTSPLYFFHVGDYGKYDRNISFDKESFRKLIKQKSEQAEVGIIPSYKSAKKVKLLRKEVHRMSNLINYSVQKARQHYIRLSLPRTYHQFIEAGIREDYSMGYPSEIGFRAGTCTPFYFFDLQNDQKTDLKIIPFAIMDGTFKYYYHVKPGQALDHIYEIIEKTKHVNGQFVSIWHNESFGNRGRDSGWKNLYEEVMKKLHG